MSSPQITDAGGGSSGGGGGSSSTGADTTDVPKSTVATASYNDGEGKASSVQEQASPRPTKLRPTVVSTETSFATSEAASSNNSANYDNYDDCDDDYDDGDDGDDSDVREGAGDGANKTKKRKMVKRSREERLEMNRMTARERRRKAKVLVDTLQEQVNDLTRHNEDLRRNNALLRAQLQAVTAQNQSGQGTNATSITSGSMSTNPAEAPGAIVSTTATAASASAGSAVSANPSPMAAPTCSSSLNLSNPSTAASIVLHLQQQSRQQQQPPQQQQQPSLASFPLSGLQQINQAHATNPTPMGSTDLQAQIDQLRQQQALRMLGLQVPAQMAMQHQPSAITAPAGIAVPSTISFRTADLAVSALSAYRQQQQQPSQGISSMASARPDPQLLANNASANTILQNLGLLGGTGALPNNQPTGSAGNAATGATPIQGTTNSNINVNNNALAQFLPALLRQQQQQQVQPPNK